MLIQKHKCPICKNYCEVYGSNPSDDIYTDYKFDVSCKKDFHYYTAGVEGEWINIYKYGLELNYLANETVIWTSDKITGIVGDKLTTMPSILKLDFSLSGDRLVKHIEDKIQTIISFK